MGSFICPITRTGDNLKGSLTSNSIFTSVQQAYQVLGTPFHLKAGSGLRRLPDSGFSDIFPGAGLTNSIFFNIKEPEHKFNAGKRS
jgi:hypothetical protein